MAQRISRAKQSIKASGVPFQRADARGARAQRLGAVLHVLYLIFNEGYTTSSGPALHRERSVERGDPPDARGPRLAPRRRRGRGPARADAPDRRAPRGAHRAGGRADPARRSRIARLWDQARDRRGRRARHGGAVAGADRRRTSCRRPIAAVHDEAPRAEDTDWPQILALYGAAERMSDNPMVTLNHAIATAMVHGPAAGLALLTALDADARVGGSPPPRRRPRAPAGAGRRSRGGDRALRRRRGRPHDEHPGAGHLSATAGGAAERRAEVASCARRAQEQGEAMAAPPLPPGGADRVRRSVQREMFRDPGLPARRDSGGLGSDAAGGRRRRRTTSATKRVDITACRPQKESAKSASSRPSCQGARRTRREHVEPAEGARREARSDLRRRSRALSRTLATPPARREAPIRRLLRSSATWRDQNQSSRVLQRAAFPRASRTIPGQRTPSCWLSHMVKETSTAMSPCSRGERRATPEAAAIGCSSSPSSSSSSSSSSARSSVGCSTL